MAEIDYDCGRFKVNTREDWNAKHGSHGTPTRDDPKEQPPSYRLIRWHCPCGAAFVEMDNAPPTNPSPWETLQVVAREAMTTLRGARYARYDRVADRLDSALRAVEQELPPMGDR